MEIMKKCSKIIDRTDRDNPIELKVMEGTVTFSERRSRFTDSLELKLDGKNESFLIMGHHVINTRKNVRLFYDGRSGRLVVKAYEILSNPIGDEAVHRYVDECCDVIY